MGRQKKLFLAFAQTGFLTFCFAILKSSLVATFGRRGKGFGDGTLTATLDGEALGSAVATDGTKTFTFRNSEGTRMLRLEFAGKGVVRLSNFRCCRGFIMTVW